MMEKRGMTNGTTIQTTMVRKYALSTSIVCIKLLTAAEQGAALAGRTAAYCMNIERGREQEPCSRVSPHVNAGRGKLLSYGYPTVRISARLLCRAFFFRVFVESSG